MKHRLLTPFFVFLLLSAPVCYAGNKNYIPMENIGLGTYYVNVNLAGLSGTQFMVDTGSGYVTINEESLLKLKQNNNAVYIRDIKGILANGSTYTVPIWKVTSLTLNNQCTLKNVEVAVFPGKTRQILGLSALKKAAPLQISFDPPRLVLSNCDIIL
jgi:predicted aspartyl protease